MNKRPYVHLYADVQDKLGILARGSNAVVFLAIGILTPAKAEGVDWQDIAGVTGLSDRAIKPALEILLTSGLIEKTAFRGKYNAANYMDYKKPTHTVCDGNDNLSINRQSSVNQSKSKAVSTEDKESFGTCLRALAAVLMSYGGMNAVEMQDFSELWTDYPDTELHERALQIMIERADRPNYRYYAAVVRSGAKPTTYPTKRESVKREKQAAVLEITL